ncbi:unnamed protein product [Durusdinium trenchii]|uniref:PDZ domain-containing protein n=1 Tax=Durusdinium trenchii TaxID=1381693 RepID=A0ABP0IC74_9DINO
MSSSLTRSWSDRSHCRIQKCWFPLRVCWDTGRLGMKLVEQDGVLVVRRTQKGTWADEMKLRIGDELVSINGQAVSQMMEQECRDTLLWRRPLRLTFARLCRASATPRLRNRLDQALQFSQSQLQDAPPRRPTTEVARSRAESVEVQGGLEEVEEKTVNTVVTQLWGNLQDGPAPPVPSCEQMEAETEDSQIEPPDNSGPSHPPEQLPERSEADASSVAPSSFLPDYLEDDFENDDEFDEESAEPQFARHQDVFQDSQGKVDDKKAQVSDRKVVFADEQLSRSQNLGLRGREIDENPPEPDIEEIQAHPAFARQVSFSSDVGEDSNKAKMRKGTAFVRADSLPESEEDDEEAHPAFARQVSFSSDVGEDSNKAKMRKGTAFVRADSLPESEEDDEEAPAAASERKVSFSHEAGVDSETARAIRRGTGFVATENLPESEDEEDEAAGKQRISVEFAWSNEYKQVPGFVPYATLRAGNLLGELQDYIEVNPPAAREGPARPPPPRTAGPGPRVAEDPTGTARPSDSRENSTRAGHRAEASTRAVENQENERKEEGAREKSPERDRDPEGLLLALLTLKKRFSKVGGREEEEEEEEEAPKEKGTNKGVKKTERQLDIKQFLEVKEILKDKERKGPADGRRVRRLVAGLRRPAAAPDAPPGFAEGGEVEVKDIPLGELAVDVEAIKFVRGAVELEQRLSGTEDEVLLRWSCMPVQLFEYPGSRWLGTRQVCPASAAWGTLQKGVWESSQIGEGEEQRRQGRSRSPKGGEDRQVRPTFKEVDEDETSEELWRLMDEALNGKDANLCPMETMPLCPSA